MIFKVFADDIRFISKLWNDGVQVEWYEMLLIGLFFFFSYFILGICFIIMRRGVAIECGYPKRSSKYMKKLMKNFSLADHIMLIKITREAESKNLLLYLNFYCHWANIVAFFITIIGFFGSMITLADGWAVTLLIIPFPITMFVTGALEFIPSFIWLPSVRRRYKLKKRYKR